MLLVRAAACTPAHPAGKSAAELPPLGPCPASSWKPEAPPPTASAKTSMVLLAVGEWARFGRQAITYSAERPRAPSSSASRSATRRSASTTTGRASASPSAAASNDVPWSAAFISWDIESAGVPRDLFCPDQRHTIYVERMVERRAGRAPPSSPHRPDERAPQVGDLICASRDGSGTTLENLNRGAGTLRHRGRGPARQVAAIGGNVGDSVTPQRLSTGRATGFCRPYPPGPSSP